MDRKTQLNILYTVVAALVIVFAQQWWIQRQQVEAISYSEFETFVKAGKVKDVSVTERHIRGTLKDPLPDGRSLFVTTRVEPALSERLAERGVRVTGAVESILLRDLLSWILPVLFFFGLWLFFFRRIAERQGVGGVMSIGKSKARVYMEKEVKVTFDDAAGVEEAKEELKEIVETAREIDCAVRELITEAFDTALACLRKYRRQLDEGATLLLARETLTREELPVLAERGPEPAPSSVTTGPRPPLERSPA